MTIFRLAMTMAAMIALATLPGCNTISGVGKDLQILGEKMEGSAEQTRRSGSNY